MENITVTGCDVCSDPKYNVMWHARDYEIRRCLNCGLIYANVTDRDIVGAYEIDYYKFVYPDYESDRNIHEMNNIRLLRKIEEYFAPGTMIEIGSAFGFFLEAAGKRKWKAAGYEMSEYAGEIARTKYHQDIRTDDYLTAEIQDKVDVICMFDTIEHLLRPSQYVQKMSRTVRNGGGLIITTGDISSWVARVFGKKWRMIAPPLHIYYYSRKTITRLLEQYGFKILSISHESKYQNLNSILKYQLGISKNAIPRLPIKVNFGDVMLVIAKRLTLP